MRTHLNRESSRLPALLLGVITIFGGFNFDLGAAGLPETLVSREPQLSLSATAAGDSGGASFSGDGRFVLFTSAADNLVTNCHNGSVVDLYVRDLVSGTVSLVSVRPDNRNGGNAHTFQGAVSDDGRQIVFESLAGNLVPGDGDAKIDFFLRDREAGTTVRISSPPIIDVQPSNDFPLLSSPAIAGDGSRAAFVRAGQLYVYERVTGLTTLLTRAWNGPAQPIPGEAFAPQFSADGSRLAFRSTAANLVRPSTGAARPLHLYVYQFQVGNINPTNLMQLRLTNNLLPVIPSGYPVADHTLSADGRYLVAAISPPTSAPTSNLGVYRFDLDTGAREHLTSTLNVTPNSGYSLAAASHNSVVAFQLRQGSASPLYTNGFFLWTPTGGLELQKISVNGSLRPLLATPIEFDAQGSRLLFTSTDTNLVTGLPDSRSRNFLREMSSGQVTLATAESAEPNGLALSPEGTRVVFESAKASLVENDFNEASDLFLRPLAGGELALLTARAEGALSQTGGAITALAEAAFTRTGNRAVFTSLANDLVELDANGAGDVFVRDLPSGTVQLVTVDRDGTASGNGHSGQPVISAEGRWVGFLSGATNLVTGDTNGRPDVFRRDLQTGGTVLISARADGSSGSGPVVAFAMSGDGQKFAFQARNTDLTGSLLTGDGIFFRALPDGLPKEISGENLSTAPAISEDGAVVAFVRGGRARLYQVATETLQTLGPADSGNVTEQVLLNTDGSRVVLVNASGKPELLRRSNEGTYTAETLPTEPAPKRRAKNVTLSANGQWLIYAAAPAGSSPIALSGNLGFNVYVRDLTTGAESQINRSYFGGGRGNGDSDQPALSPDGRYVLFRSGASDLVPDDDNGEADVFLHDRITGLTRLVTRALPNAALLTARSYRGRFGADSTTAWLHTFAADAVSGDFNNTSEAIRFPLEPDTDSDGLDDAWEIANFGNLEQNGSSDFDQDSASNAAEFAAGTLPKDSASQLFASLVPLSEEVFTLSWPAVPGKRYRVLMATDLASADATRWLVASSVLTATSETLSTEIQVNITDYERYFTLAVAP